MKNNQQDIPKFEMRDLPEYEPTQRIVDELSDEVLDEQRRGGSNDIAEAGVLFKFLSVVSWQIATGTSTDTVLESVNRCYDSEVNLEPKYTSVMIEKVNDLAHENKYEPKRIYAILFYTLKAIPEGLVELMTEDEEYEKNHPGVKDALIKILKHYDKRVSETYPGSYVRALQGELPIPK